MICIFDFHYSDKPYLRYICLTKSARAIQFLIFLLKISRDAESFMAFGKMSHIFGPKKETVSVPYLTEFTLRLVRTLFPRKLKLFLSTKISLIRDGENPCKNFYISVARILIYLWCIVTAIILNQVLERWWLVIIRDSQCSFVYSIYFIIKASTMEEPN